MPSSQLETPTEEILGQIGVFFRRTIALFQVIKPRNDGLERPAYVLLSRVDDSGPLRLSALAATVQLKASTISRQVAALEEAGMIIREQDPADGRASLIRISELGRTVLEHNRAQWRAELTTMLADWTEAERKEFARLFTRLNETMATRCAMEDK